MQTQYCWGVRARVGLGFSVDNMVVGTVYGRGPFTVLHILYIRVNYLRDKKFMIFMFWKKTTTLSMVFIHER